MRLGRLLQEGGLGVVHPIADEERLQRVNGASQILNILGRTLEHSLRDEIVGVVLRDGFVDALDAGDNSLLHGGLLLDAAQLDEQAFQLLHRSLLGLVLHVGGLDLLDEILQGLGLPRSNGEIILDDGGRLGGLLGGDEDGTDQCQCRYNGEQSEEPGASALNPALGGLAQDAVGVLSLEGGHRARVCAEFQHGLGLFSQSQLLIDPFGDPFLGGQQDEQHDQKTDGGYDPTVKRVIYKVRFCRGHFGVEPQSRQGHDAERQPEYRRTKYRAQPQLTPEFGESFSHEMPLFLCKTRQNTQLPIIPHNTYIIYNSKNFVNLYYNKYSKRIVNTFPFSGRKKHRRARCLEFEIFSILHASDLRMLAVSQLSFPVGMDHFPK